MDQAAQMEADKHPAVKEFTDILSRDDNQQVN